MDQGSVDISREQFRSRVYLALPYENGVALGMACAAAVPADFGMILLIGMIFCNRSGDQVYAGILSLHLYFKICGSLFLTVRHDPLMDDQLRSGSKHRFCGAFRKIHAADLDRIHLHHGVFLQFHVCHRIDLLQTDPGACSHMFLLIKNMGSLLQEKAVDTIVFRLALIIRMDAAACHDRHVGAFSHEEIIIDEIVYISPCHTGRNINGLLLRFRTDMDLKAGAVGFGFYFDML